MITTKSRCVFQFSEKLIYINFPSGVKHNQKVFNSKSISLYSLPREQCNFWYMRARSTYLSGTFGKWTEKLPNESNSKVRVNIDDGIWVSAFTIYRKHSNCQWRYEINLTFFFFFGIL